MAVYIGTSGNDTQVGSSSPDTFDYSQGGSDTLSGGDGNDTFTFGAAFDATDSVNGGANTPGNPGDTLSLNGNYSSQLIITGAMLSNVETISIPTSGFSYN